MKMAKLAVMATIGCLSTAMQTYGQLESKKPELTQERKGELAYYRKLHEDLQTKLKEVRHAIGLAGANGTGEKAGVDRCEELSVRISELKTERAAAYRTISRNESKQMVLQAKLVRIEKELARALQEMPNDPVAQALKKLVEIDESAYTLMKKKFEAGQIPSNELSTSERKLAESRLELAKHQWEESADVRKALAAANAAIEEAVFETEMQVSEKAQVEKEIAALANERGRLKALVLEESELMQRSADILHMMGIIRGEHPLDVQDNISERLRKQGVKLYEPGKPVEKAAEPSTDPGK